MTTTEVLALLLALSFGINIALVAGILARRAGAGTVQILLAGGGVVGTVLTIFFTAVGAYR